MSSTSSNLVHKSDSPLFYIICGERSGDYIVSRVIAQLRVLYPKARFVGIGGDLCREQGMEITFDCGQISVMGFWEILPRVPRIVSIINKTVKSILDLKPDMLITVDSWGFNSRVVSKVRQKLGREIKCVHYIAPTVWVYNETRAEKAAQLWDHLFVILPFESIYFNRHGLNTTFVGHPFFERFQGLQHKISHNVKEQHILLMPGSRWQEISKIAPIFKEAALALREKMSQVKLTFYVPTFPQMLPALKTVFDDDGFVFVTDEVDKKELFQKVDFAIVKSGTSSVEMMICDIPCVVAYKLSKLSYYIIKRKVKVKFISIVNLLLGREVVREFIQGECTADNIASYASQILLNAEERKTILSGYQEAKVMLRVEDGKYASEIVAAEIGKLLQR